MKKIFIKLTRLMTKGNRVFCSWENIRWNKPTFRKFISNVSHTKKIVAVYLSTSKSKGKLIVGKTRRFNINSFSIPHNIKGLFSLKSFINSFRASQYFNRFFLSLHSLINISFSIFTSCLRFARTFVFFRKNNESVARFVSPFILKESIFLLNSYPFRVTFFTKPMSRMRDRFSSTFEALFMFNRPHNYSISMTGQYVK